MPTGRGRAAPTTAACSPRPGSLPEDGLIAERAGRWRFGFPAAADHERRDAVHEAAVFIRDRPQELPDGAAPANATQHAVLAVEMHERFLR